MVTSFKCLRIESCFTAILDWVMPNCVDGRIEDLDVLFEIGVMDKNSKATINEIQREEAISDETRLNRTPSL